MKRNLVAVREWNLTAGIADFAELVRPEITVTVLVTTIGGFFLGCGELPTDTGFFPVLLGTWLIAAGGSALNQFVERDTDALMQRTARRPLPAGRLHPHIALLFGMTLSFGGMVVLAVTVNLLTALLGTVALLAYVLVYTPLKRVTPLSTLIGAVPGAVPPVMGWTAVQNDLGLGALALFGILFLWQLPHFLAIAWLCRSDYARAGLPTLTTFDPGGRRTARHMMLPASLLLPVSLLPSVVGLTGTIYLLGVLGLGLLLLGFCVAFFLSSSARAARHVLLISLIYLLGVVGVLILDRTT